MANDHDIALSTGEQRARDRDAHGVFVSDTGIPLVPSSSLTIDPFACDAYV